MSDTDGGATGETDAGTTGETDAGTTGETDAGTSEERAGEPTDRVDDRRPAGSAEGERAGPVTGGSTDRYADLMNRFIHGVELAAAAVFAILFAIGVVDLSLQIVESVRSGRITDPLVVIGFIDTGLLLLIIVEVYQTVIAYTQESETRRIVRLVVYTGVIAMVRKVIIFRTGEFATVREALLVAVSYTVIIIGLVGLLYVDQVFDDRFGSAEA